MLQKLGLTADRFRVEYVSAAEGIKFAQVVKDMSSRLSEIGKNKVEAENEKLKPYLDRMLDKKAK